MSNSPNPSNPSGSNGSETVVVVGGQDWDEVVDIARRNAGSNAGGRPPCDPFPARLAIWSFGCGIRDNPTGL